MQKKDTRLISYVSFHSGIGVDFFSLKMEKVGLVTSMDLMRARWSIGKGCQHMFMKNGKIILGVDLNFTIKRVEIQENVTRV